MTMSKNGATEHLTADTFTMSMYAKKEDLYKAKSEHFESFVEALKAANADKDAVIKHLGKELYEAEQVIKAMRAVIDRMEKPMCDKCTCAYREIISGEKIITLIAEELRYADKKYGSMKNRFDGLHTIKCEMAEFERAVVCGHDHDDLEKEAVQVAAMAVKFLRDCVL